MKKVITALMIIIFASFLVACGGDNNVTRDERVLNVKIYRAGYGDRWLEEMGKAFSETFKEEGYTVKIIESAYTLNVDSELLTPKRNMTDIYFVSGIDLSAAIDQSFNILKTNEETLLLDLTDVLYNAKPINVNKEEENIRIIDKMNPEILQYQKYYGVKEKWHDRYFLLPWVRAVTGFVYDAELLREEFGLEMPRTTDEFIEQIDIIRESYKDIAPIVSAMANAPRYWRYVTDVWWSQYSGAKAFENFFKMIPATGDTLTNGYDVYDDEGLRKAYEVLAMILRPENAPAASGSWDHDRAQNSLLTGKSMFMVTGDWLPREMEEHFSEKSENMAIMPAPIISDLGVKLRLDGSSSGAVDRTKAEAVLREIVSCIDQGKTESEVVSLIKQSHNITLAETVVKEVFVARGIYTDLGINHSILIPSYAKNKDLAVLFLRFMASDDGIRIFRKYAKAALPFNYGGEDMELTPFQASSYKISSYKYTYGITEFIHFSPIRSIGGLQIFNKDNNVELSIWNDTLLSAEEKAGKLLRERAQLSAQKFIKSEYDYVKENWESLLFITGLR